MVQVHVVEPQIAVQAGDDQSRHPAGSAKRLQRHLGRSAEKTGMNEEAEPPCGAVTVDRLPEAPVRGTRRSISI